MLPRRSRRRASPAASCPSWAPYGAFVGALVLSAAVAGGARLVHDRADAGLRRARRDRRDLRLVARRRGAPPGQGPDDDDGDRRRLRAGDGPADLARSTKSSSAACRASLEFFTADARGVVGGGGAAHAIVGTLIITGVAA